MELFVGLDRAPNYLEVNASPSGDWATYFFEAYRERADCVISPPYPRGISVLGPPERRTLCFAIDLRGIADIIGLPRWRWQPTAILETEAGPTYWAPSHPTDKPDFHLLDHLPDWDPYEHREPT
jgi:hypothetical protein